MPEAGWREPPDRSPRALCGQPRCSKQIHNLQYTLPIPCTCLPVICSEEKCVQPDRHDRSLPSTVPPRESLLLTESSHPPSSDNELAFTRPVSTALFASPSFVGIVTGVIAWAELLTRCSAHDCVPALHRPITTLRHMLETDYLLIEPQFPSPSSSKSPSNMPSPS